MSNLKQVKIEITKAFRTMEVGGDKDYSNLLCSGKIDHKIFIDCVTDDPDFSSGEYDGCLCEIDCVSPTDSDWLGQISKKLNTDKPIIGFIHMFDFEGKDVFSAQLTMSNKQLEELTKCVQINSVNYRTIMILHIPSDNPNEIISSRGDALEDFEPDKQLPIHKIEITAWKIDP